jgi:probable HAF family extracellular repeat protein
MVTPPVGEGAFGQAEAVNDRGQVAGYTWDLHGIGPNAFVWTDGVYTPVPTPTGISYGVDINNAGHVLLNRDPDSYPGEFIYLQAGVLIGDREITSPVFPGQRPIVGVAINNRGTVIGNAEDEADPSRLTGYVWRPGRDPVSLSTFGGYSRAFEINDRGTVLGLGTTEDGRTTTVLWRRGRLTEVGLQIHENRYWRDDRLNNRNQVVGQIQTATGETHAALWSRGRTIDLGTLGGPTSIAIGINDRGEVVGTSERSDGTSSAFLWRDGTMIDIGVLTGRPNVGAYEINDRGQVLGLVSDIMNAVPRQTYLWETRPKR